MTYAELRADVIQAIGDERLAEHMDSLVRRAEKMLSRRIRDVRMLTTADVVMSGGEGQLPDDFLEEREVATVSGVPLEAKPKRWAKLSGAYYAIVGNKLLSGARDGSLSLTYYAALPTITSGHDGTNWLLEAAPDLYEAAVCRWAAKHLRDMEALEYWRQRLDDEILNFRRDSWDYGHAGRTIEIGDAT